MASSEFRDEESRGWRRALWWLLGLALVLAGILVVGSLSINRITPTRTGMDQLAKESQAPEGKQAMGVAKVRTKASVSYGSYLIDDFGHPLYLFKGDKRGRPDEVAVSTCYEDCARVWPPLITSGQPKATEQTQADLLSTFRRKDGSDQVTYNGWPLYRYARDTGPDRPTGQDVEEFDAEWYLIAPSGDEVQRTDNKRAAQ